MSNKNELVKWQPSEAGRKIDAALARIRNGAAEGRLIPSRREETAPEVVDLQRVCAVHDKPYTARYVRGRDGRYRYAQSIRVTETLYRGQYAENEPLSVGNGFLAEECCAWCGASGFAAVHCTGCEADVCYGKTVARYFRCRKSCGREGNLVAGNFRQVGFRPCAGSEGTVTAG